MKKTGLRIFSLALAVCMLSTLIGCNDSGDKDTDTKTDNSDSNIEFLVNPEDYRGTKVVYATWKDPEKNEDGEVIKKFEEKYGIDVEILLIGQGEYVSAIASKIASGTQPDIFFENGTYPGSVSVMEPLDRAKINFDDPIWSQSIIKKSTLEGHPYLVDTLSNVWAETDIVVYNKKIFEDNNITTPEEYYENGKWTFAAFKECAKQIASLGKGYTGAGIISNAGLAAGNATIVGYENGKIVNKADSHLYDVMSFFSQMKEDGYLTLNHTSFNDGKVGMVITNCFALKKTGYYTSINPDHLGMTYLPTWEEGSEPVVSGIYRGWGLVKGAKNPEAAGIFLREYLDVNNYDLDNTFHSQEAANFFFKVTGNTSEDVLYYFVDGTEQATGLGDSYADSWNRYSAAQIRGYLDGQQNVINNMCNKANDLLDTEKNWIKENY